MKTISIDFDGVIHKYSKGWDDGTCYDEPVEGSIEFLVTLLRADYSVFILSTREPVLIKEWLDKYLYKNTGFCSSVIIQGLQFWNIKRIVGITNRKLPAHVYIDDRGIKFNGNFNEMLEAVENFKTWQDK